MNERGGSGLGKLTIEDMMGLFHRYFEIAKELSCDIQEVGGIVDLFHRIDLFQQSISQRRDHFLHRDLSQTFFVRHRFYMLEVVVLGFVVLEVVVASVSVVVVDDVFHGFWHEFPRSLHWLCLSPKELGC